MHYAWPSTSAHVCKYVCVNTQALILRCIGRMMVGTIVAIVEVFVKLQSE